MSAVNIRNINILDADAECIVNAANTGLRGGSGVCGAIFNAAGWDDMQRACDRLGRCPTGGAVITPGFALKAEYVIHAVGPVWYDGKHGEERLLRDAYRSALKIAMEHGLHSIAFPLISAGIYGYPVEEAWTVAKNVCTEFILENSAYEIRILFAIPDKTLFSRLTESIDK